MSSLGRSTTVTVVSMACSAALRWMACVTMARARSAACSRASVSSRFTRLAASRRASASICLISSSRASSLVRPASRSRSFRCRATSSSYRAALVATRLLARAQRLLTASQRAVALLERQLLLDERRLALHQDLLDAGDLLPVIARVLLGLDAQLVRALLGLEQRFLASRVVLALGVAQDARRLFFGAADGLGGEALAVGEPIAEDRRGGGKRDDEIEGVVQDLARHESPLAHGPSAGACFREGRRPCRCPRKPPVG